MIPKGRITPEVLRSKAIELRTLANELVEMTNRVESSPNLIGHQEYPGNSFRQRETQFEKVTRPEQRQWQMSNPSDVDVLREDVRTCASKIEDADEAIQSLKAQVVVLQAQMEHVNGSTLVEQINAITRGMANSVRRLEHLEEEVRQIKEAQVVYDRDMTRDMADVTRRLARLEGNWGDTVSQQVQG